MQPRFETIPERKLAGKHLTMSLANNRTAELWRSFMPRRNDIQNKLNNDLYSLQVYPPDYFEVFNPSREFEKWALVEVADHDQLPAAMEALTLPGGLYAVFHYTGLNTDTRIFQYIYGEWLPNSEYVPDDRPHFEILGEKYMNNDPNSKEEIWIPVRTKV